MSLSDELRKTLAAKPERNGRHAFLVFKKEIEQALSEGFTIAETWRCLYENGRVPIQYRQFVRYVQRFITKEESNNTSAAPRQCSEHQGHELLKKVSSSSKVSPHFEYDPMGKTKSDLI